MMNMLAERETLSTESHFPSSENDLKVVDQTALSNDHQIAYEALLTPVEELRITCGAYFGEKIQVAEDFIAGDCLKLAQSTSSIPVFLSNAEDQVLVTMSTPVDIGKHQFFGKKVLPIVLMSENGRILNGSIIVDRSTPKSVVFLLLAEALEPSVEYTVL